MGIRCRYLKSNNLAIFYVFLFVVLLTISVCTQVSAATLTVTNKEDSGVGSLRQLIYDAVSGDVITFDENVTGTITLVTQLTINKNITIQGPGPEILSLSGNGDQRIFYITPSDSVTISGLSIVNGNAETTSGGGIYNQSSNLTLINCEVSGNSAWIGGGICDFRSNSTLINCTIRENSAEYGGALFGDGSSSTVTNCTFSDNSARQQGSGIYYTNCSNTTVTNCTFYNNSVPYGGGGMLNSRSNPTVKNCTFSANDGGSYGGGMYNYVSSPVVNNCTFNSNIATLGDGMFNDISSNPLLTNCIFWDENDEIYNQAGVPTLSYCIVRSDDYGVGSIILGDITSTDPMLGPLADNGGPTQTCALLPGSSAIDAGIELGDVATDQRGVLRPKGSGYDIGAYEVVNRYTINAYHNTGGIVSPESADVWEGESMDFTLLPDLGYEVWEVYIDGDPVSYDEIDLTYTFGNVSADHVISADFQPCVNGSGSGGCNISALLGIGLLLVAPLIFLSKKIR